jgi:hypothetical protein
MVRSVEQPGGTRAILEMYRARQVDAERAHVLCYPAECSLFMSQPGLYMTLGEAEAAGGLR